MKKVEDYLACPIEEISSVVTRDSINDFERLFTDELQTVSRSLPNPDNVPYVHYVECRNYARLRAGVNLESLLVTALIQLKHNQIAEV